MITIAGFRCSNNNSILDSLQVNRVKSRPRSKDAIQRRYANGSYDTKFGDGLMGEGRERLAGKQNRSGMASIGD